MARTCIDRPGKLAGNEKSAAMKVRKSGRGSALLAVLVLSGLTLLLLLAFATSSTSNLSLTRHQVDGVQGDAQARAAVQEFILQLQALHQPGDATQVPASVFEYFKHNHVLIAQDSRLGCEARLLTQGRYHSVDNSLASVPAQSCFDGPNQKSVPPFSVSLVMQIQTGRRTFLYEAYLQQVWPYALTAPGPIRVFGGEVAQDLIASNGLGQEVAYKGRQLGGWKGSSSIQGHVLATQSNLAPLDNSSGQLDQPVPISEVFYGRLFAFSKGNLGVGVQTDLPNTRMQVGGDFSVLNYRKRTRTSYDDSGTETKREVWEAQLVALRTENARIEGGIDLYENPSQLGEEGTTPEVYVAPGAEHKGRVRQNFRFRGLDPNSEASRQMFAKMFIPPDTSSWTQIQNDELAMLTGETTLSSRNRSGGRVITIPTGQVVYHGDIKLGTSDSDLPSLVLEDIALAVKGNVVLGPAASALFDPGERPTLKGSNATLIVEGSLIVDNGQLDAGGNGMVIFCRDFIMKAKGRYNGLIIAQRGGAFVGSDPGEGSQVVAGDEASELLIRGGVIVGGRHLTVEGPAQPAPGPEQLAPILFPPIRLTSLAMISTRIEYDPKYLRTINQFGNFRLVAVQRRQ
jgi:hypothetical protein